MAKISKAEGHAYARGTARGSDVRFVDVFFVVKYADVSRSVLLKNPVRRGVSDMDEGLDFRIAQLPALFKNLAKEKVSVSLPAVWSCDSIAEIADSLRFQSFAGGVADSRDAHRLVVHIEKVCRLGNPALRHVFPSGPIVLLRQPRTVFGVGHSDYFVREAMLRCAEEGQTWRHVHCNGFSGIQAIHIPEGRRKRRSFTCDHLISHSI